MFRSGVGGARRPVSGGVGVVVVVGVGVVVGAYLAKREASGDMYDDGG